MKAIRTLIPVYSDLQTPFNANIESSIELNRLSYPQRIRVTIRS